MPPSARACLPFAMILAVAACAPPGQIARPTIPAEAARRQPVPAPSPSGGAEGTPTPGPTASPTPTPAPTSLGPIVAGLPDLGHGAPASRVPVNQIVGVTAGPDGGVLLNALGRLARIDADGTFRQLSGTPATSLSPEGQPAKETGLYLPAARSWDSEGRLLVNEYDRLLRLEANGRYKTIWPAGALKVVGAVPAEGGVLVFAEDPAAGAFSLWRIGADLQREELVAFGTIENAILATTRELYYPVAVDRPSPRAFARDAAGALLVWTPSAVYAIEVGTGALTERLALTERPVAMDAHGNMFFQPGGARTLEVHPPAGERRVLTEALPEGLRVDYASMDEAGVVLMNGLPEGSRGHQPIYRLENGRTTTLTGPAPGLPADRRALSLVPTGLVSEPTGAIVIADWMAGRLIRVAADGSVSLVGGAAGGPKAATGLSLKEVSLSPGTLGRDDEGRLYILDRQEKQTQVLQADAAGTITVRRAVAQDETTGAYEKIEDFAVAPDGTLYLLYGRYEKSGRWFKRVGMRVTVLDDDGERTLEGHSPVIEALGIDTAGRLLMRGRAEEVVGETAAYTLWRANAAGAVSAVATWVLPVPLYDAPGLAVDDEGRVYQAGGSRYGMIYRLDPETAEVVPIAGPGGRHFTGDQPDDGVRSPTHPVLDPFGRLVFLDAIHGQVKLVDAQAH